jgi:hypothetical protein
MPILPGDPGDTPDVEAAEEPLGPAERDLVVLDAVTLEVLACGPAPYEPGSAGARSVCACRCAACTRTHFGDVVGSELGPQAPPKPNHRLP